MSIFVGNLPFRAEQEDVAELFAPFGDVVNCSLPLERDTGRKRGFAFVELADDAAETRAIEALQGAELMGRPLRINKAEPRGSGGPRRSEGGYSGGRPPERGGYGGGSYGGGGGYGGGGAPRAGGYGAPADSSGGAERGSGASGWEDRSYGGGSEGFEEGRSRRRRSGSTGGGGDSYGDDGYGGAEV
ncbi:RNA-binding protein [Cyanobium sp. Morenito 9A2]|uniref:RNA recognition motif domain-containing protein n=1 Tax=Cyanobium sp. Morenito 9A2 TaxID=2823718 RepID=UPI0020CDEE5B|nr:RNA-binding protein [Cyanobium sp. Morenito 9A2]MCP9850303.1 RNA-binding protein [Cyanobium sp. Morenito 9A2]